MDLYIKLSPPATATPTRSLPRAIFFILAILVVLPWFVISAIQSTPLELLAPETLAILTLDAFLAYRVCAYLLLLPGPVARLDAFFYRSRRGAATLFVLAGLFWTEFLGGILIINGIFTGMLLGALANGEWPIDAASTAWMLAQFACFSVLLPLTGWSCAVAISSFWSLVRRRRPTESAPILLAEQGVPLEEQGALLVHHRGTDQYRDHEN